MDRGASMRLVRLAYPGASGPVMVHVTMGNTFQEKAGPEPGPHTNRARQSKRVRVMADRARPGVSIVARGGDEAHSPLATPQRPIPGSCWAPDSRPDGGSINPTKAI
ncbi:hypothetical protein DPEC_G00026740 [Dallia pectoralis]|uniref:Uncharacterized protein n=1 Tax=Dallia pectoralis TaxID=75939 RepID=A0ACC2HHW2_DALPE|nr:hypothetical protein DPEC_G00026740 [Dallia pectoralis]